MWWASLGLVSCLWSEEGEEEESQQYYTIIEDLSNKWYAFTYIYHYFIDVHAICAHLSNTVCVVTESIVVKY